MSSWPSFLQRTVVAGEPEEIHLRVNSDPYSEVLSNDEVTTEAIEDQDLNLIIN